MCVITLGSENVRDGSLVHSLLPRRFHHCCHGISQIICYTNTTAARDLRIVLCSPWFKKESRCITAGSYTCVCLCFFSRRDRETAADRDNMRPSATGKNEIYDSCLVVCLPKPHKSRDLNSMQHKKRIVYAVNV